MLCILFLMFWLHVLEDFVLQTPSLAKLKQKKWWQENYPQPMYANDYVMALILHGLSWSTLVHMPLFFLAAIPEWMIGISIVVNAFIHILVDNAKANKHKLSLALDQMIHLIQIVLTWTILFLVAI